MTTTTEKKTAAAPEPAPVVAHDRVAMLSVRADGTLDQAAPELIGDKAATVAATQRQFAEQAVSAADDAARRAANATADAGVQDPAITELQAAHDAAAAKAKEEASAIVDSLHQG